MTLYVVFQKDDHGWQHLGTHEARSASSAIRTHIDRAEGSTEGEWAAVPLRSWKPVTVKVETKTALKFS